MIRRIDWNAYLNLVGPLHSGQIAVHHALHNAPRGALMCGRRWGKTTYLSRVALYHMLCGRRIWWVAPTHRLASIGYRYCAALIRNLPAAVQRRIRRKRSAPFRIQYQAGWLEFMQTGRPDSLQGEGLDGVIYDEAATSDNGAQIVEQYLLPTLLDRGGWLLAASTPKGRNWFAEYVNAPDTVACTATSYDNPMLAHTAIDELKATMAPDYFRQEILAEIVESVGRYWPQLPDVTEERPTGPADICGIDWGTSSPFAAIWVWAQPQPHGHVFTVGTEHYQQHLTPDQQAAAVLNGAHARRYVADASTPAHVVEQWRMAGLTPAPGTRDRVGGWAAIRQLIAAGRLRIHSSCFNIQREFADVTSDPKRLDDCTGDDHALDALRYALMALPPKMLHGIWIDEEHNRQQLAQLRLIRKATGRHT